MDTTQPPQPALSPRTFALLTLGLLAVGLVWRVTRYLLQFPIWGDEALLAINFATLDYSQLTAQLKNCQIAPLLFLWGERTAFAWFGPSELSLRLLPFLAGVTSLFLFWHLTGLLLSPEARLYAVGFLAVAIWPVSMCTLIKPYSCDLLMCLVLLVPAAHYLRHPNHPGFLVLLTFLAPLALLTSYPAAFVGGGVSLALLVSAWHNGWATRLWFAAYNFALVASFALVILVAHNHLGTEVHSGITTKVGMTTYWMETFPPTNVLSAVWWFFLQTTGQMAAYPLGAVSGGSALTTLCAVAGVIWWARHKQWQWVALFTAPLLLNLVAAVMHRYPYGGSGRLCQHLAPGFCLLAGLGVAALLESLRLSEAQRTRWAVAGFVFFALVGAVGLVRDVLWPYREEGYAWMRSATASVRATVPRDEPMVVCNQQEVQECVFTYHWLTGEHRVSWDYELPPDIASLNRIWGFCQNAPPEAALARLEAKLRQQDANWRLVKRTSYVYHPRRRRESGQRCELFCCERGDGRVVAATHEEKVGW